MQFGNPDWIDTIFTRLGDLLSAGVSLSPDLVFVYEGNPTDLLTRPPGNKFLVMAPARLDVDLPKTAGGGSSHTVFNPSVFRVEVMQLVGGDQEYRSYRAFKRVDGIGQTVRAVIRTLQMETLDDGAGSPTTPLIEPMRLLSCEFNPRIPPSGWSWCRTLWSIKFRATLEA